VFDYFDFRFAELPVAPATIGGGVLAFLSSRHSEARALVSSRTDDRILLTTCGWKPALAPRNGWKASHGAVSGAESSATMAAQQAVAKRFCC
jgi:hypothetical protein